MTTLKTQTGITAMRTAFAGVAMLATTSAMSAEADLGAQHLATANADNFDCSTGVETISFEGATVASGTVNFDMTQHLSGAGFGAADTSTADCTNIVHAEDVKSYVWGNNNDNQFKVLDDAKQTTSEGRAGNDTVHLPSDSTNYSVQDNGGFLNVVASDTGAAHRTKGIETVTYADGAIDDISGGTAASVVRVQEPTERETAIGRAHVMTSATETPDCSGDVKVVDYSASTLVNADIGQTSRGQNFTNHGDATGDTLNGNGCTGVVLPEGTANNSGHAWGNELDNDFAVDFERVIIQGRGTDDFDVVHLSINYDEAVFAQRNSQTITVDSSRSNRQYYQGIEAYQFADDTLVTIDNSDLETMQVFPALVPVAQ